MKDEQSDSVKEVIDLWCQLVDGDIEPDDLDRLRTLLMTDSDCLDWYVRLMTLESTIHLDLCSPSDVLNTTALVDPSESIKFSESDRSHNHRTSFLLMVCGAAIAASVLLAFWTISMLGPEAPVAKVEVTKEVPGEFNSRLTRRRAVAVITRVAEIGPDSSRSLMAGTPLAAGRFRVDSGMVQLDFLSGATVVVQGPAELDLVSTMKLNCLSGNVRAHVPPHAKGFTIDMPKHSAVDLGTDFAVSVSDDRSSQVHVLEGEVELFERSRDDSPKPKLFALKDGQAISSNSDGHIIHLSAETDRFIGVEMLAELASSDESIRYLAWKNSSSRLEEQDSVIAYFDFESHKPWARSLSQVKQGPMVATDGAIVGCRWTQGRWPGKSALEFKGVEDRVRLDIPGEYESITLACWIQIGGFDRRLSSLLLTEGHELGEVHWQFTGKGELLLGVKAEPDKSQEYITPVALTPDDVGRWIHLACVYDSQSGNVRHYRDGSKVNQRDIEIGTLLRFGKCEIGNWAPTDFIDFRIRALNGCIDEFVVLKRPLSDEEISALCDEGRPI